jgi:chlorobactene glucosyltransferase
MPAGLARDAVEEDADWLCFVDADVWAEPALIASAVAAVCSEALDLLQLAPRQELQSFAERLVMPCGLYLLAFCQDLRTMQARDSSEVTATGQFMLVRRASYDAIGGHAAVRGAICEDLMLARLLKRSGGYAILQDGHRLLSTRMYRGWSTLWIGIAKNLGEMLGGPLRTITIAAAAVVLAWAAWLIPLRDALDCTHGGSASCVGLIPAALGSAAAFGLHITGSAYLASACCFRSATPRARLSRLTACGAASRAALAGKAALIHERRAEGRRQSTLALLYDEPTNKALAGQ